MTYKGMFLSALLVPIASALCVQDVDLLSHNLSEAQVKKLQELSAISVKIAEKQALIDSWTSQAKPIFESLTTDDEMCLDEYLKKIEKAVCENKDTSGLLVKDFSIVDSKKYAFNFIKIFTIRICVERALMARLIESYENCLQELIKIN